MNATINVLLFKSKTLADGSHPLMIRICKDNKKKYKSLGVSIFPQYWDFEKNKPRRNCPKRDFINTLISDKIKEFSEQLIEFQTESKEFTVTKLIEKVVNPRIKSTVDIFLDEEIERLKNERRYGYEKTYRHLKTSLLAFNKHLDIYFSEIDFNWIVQYEAYLRVKGLKTNSIGIRFRTLRTLYNRAISTNLVKADCYPFKQFKMSKLKETTIKRSITKADIERIISYEAPDEYVRLSIDLFYFSYLSGGVNFVDMAYLTRNNIIDNRLVYNRIKTKKLIKLPIQRRALEIIESYKSDSPYLFPILSNFHKTDQQKANRIHKVIGNVNRYLKVVGQELKLPIDLTTYVARHTYATVLKRSGVNTSIISESLGHSSEKVTQIYLDSFENSQIDEAMKNLL
ncbi:MAG: site-specific integrase [Dysgonomonas mossii]|uniref:site-specific integrase n=1 Tax=Dysgonomonas mossii TaxID=163665 RepID=UPI001DEDC788|nr:site-specific integrase [Dysgonomonas mossii]MBS5796142.1 site-specific integrase [Dysgonomonas mossii]MBS7110938.1 site-specific integrase [Dysgonomonas mossii]